MAAKAQDHEVSVAEGPDGELVGIVAFAGLKGSNKPRPRLKCAGCDGEVIPRVGGIRKAHFAHLGRNDCWVVTKEGRAHLEAKLHLAEQLRAIPPEEREHLGLHVHCGDEGDGNAGAPLFACKAEDHLAFGPWTRVKVEKRASLSTRRPDLLLLDEDGAVVVSIEIMHTHAVDENKAAELYTLGIRWVEIDVSGDGLAKVLAWRANEKVLPVSRTSVELAWRCDAHATVEAPAFVKLIDYYFPTPEPWLLREHARRDIAWVTRRWVHGEQDTDTLYVRTAFGVPERLGSWPARKEQAAGRRLGVYLREIRESMPVGTRQDVSEWIMLEHVPATLRGQAVQALRSDFERIPYRLRWSEEKKRIVTVPRRFSWFRAKEMRLASAVFILRLQGNSKPLFERPRHPYAVPEIPKHLRAVWVIEQMADLWLGHLNGDRPIAGMPPMTREDFFAWIKGERQIEFDTNEVYQGLLARAKTPEAG